MASYKTTISGGEEFLCYARTPAGKQYIDQTIDTMTRDGTISREQAFGAIAGKYKVPVDSLRVAYTNGIVFNPPNE